jgi:undecaprenyl-diphosphatase
LNTFDASIITFLNQFAHRSWGFDQAINLFANNILLKGGVLATILWWAWFKGSDDDGVKNRKHVIATLIACFVALFIGRLLAITLPYRPRPIHNPDFVFQHPYGVMLSNLDGWSAFPSDHALLFFTLTTGLFFISRTAGILSTIYCFLLMVVARIYLGLHHPTDLLAGAVIGIAIAWLANATNIFAYFTNMSLRLYNNKPALFYPAFFLLTHQIATMFIDVRELGGSAFKYLKMLLGITGIPL